MPLKSKSKVNSRNHEEATYLLRLANLYNIVCIFRVSLWNKVQGNGYWQTALKISDGRLVNLGLIGCPTYDPLLFYSPSRWYNMKVDT